MKRNKWKQALPFILFFAASFGIGFVVAKLVLMGVDETAVGSEQETDVPLAVFLLKMGWLLFSLFFAIAAHIVLHEAGHMVAALSRGWKFLSFMIVGIVLSRRDGRFRLSRFSVAGAGGQCLMLPPEKGDTDAGIALYNAGGVLVNLLVVLAAGIALAAGYSTLSFAWKAFLMPQVLVGLFLAVVNGVPMTLGGLPNDGKNLLNLRKDAFATQAFLQSMRLIGMLMQNNLSAVKAQQPMCEGREVDFANPIHVMALSMDLSVAMARMDFDGARAILHRIGPHEHQLPQIYRNELAFEQIYLTLIEPHEAADIDRLLTEPVQRHIRQQVSFRPTALRVRYALARLHESDEAKAEKLHEKFQKVCRSYYIQGEVTIERRLVEYIRQLPQA